MWRRLLTLVLGSRLAARLLRRWVEREQARLQRHDRAVFLEELQRWEQEGGTPPGPGVKQGPPAPPRGPA